MIRRAPLLAAAGLVLGGASLAGQAGPDLIARGMQAYRTLEFDNAAALLNRGLSGNAGASMPDSARSDAFTYLGASELMRGRKDLAEAAFREALAVEPRFRPDSLIFPPQITDAFEQVRRNTAYVKVRVPRDTTITYGADHYVVRLYASARHEGTVEIAAGAGRAKRIYAGPIADSMDVRWEGADLTGRAPLTGSAFLQVVSREQGRARTVRVPLTIQAVHRDTLPLPQRPTFTPVNGQSGGPSSRALGALGLGILGGAAAIMLPEIIASDGAGGSVRYYIGGALAFAGLLGFAVQQNRASTAVTEATTDRAMARDRWSRRVDSVRAENERIRRDVRLRITTGGSANRGKEGEAP